ncbi:MAG: glycosyltransferase [Candidatus Paceibacterota bacterium]|jgi:glycosyltransferase involved in cell wall biosynthesis
MISIIIPTLNEENNLKRILDPIKNSKFKDYEVIIADAGSTDGTLKVASDYGCIITKGGLPAKGRNSGAQIAKGDIFLFLDADIDIRPYDFLYQASKRFNEKKLDIASFPIYPQKNNLYMNPFTLNIFYNIPQFIFQDIFPMGAMGIMVKKELFEKVGGFDETISLAEDHYFIRQADITGKFGIISSVRIYMPLRRFETDGYFRTAFKYLFCGIRLIFSKPTKNVKYDFGHYKDNNKKK